MTGKKNDNRTPAQQAMDVANRVVNTGYDPEIMRPDVVARREQALTEHRKAFDAAAAERQRQREKHEREAARRRREREDEALEPIKATRRREWMADHPEADYVAFERVWRDFLRPLELDRLKQRQREQEIAARRATGLYEI